RVLELLFLVVVIGHAAAVVDAAAAIDRLRLVQEGIGEGRLARHLMPDQCNGANVFRFVSHDVLLKEVERECERRDGVGRTRERRSWAEVSVACASGERVRISCQLNRKRTQPPTKFHESCNGEPSCVSSRVEPAKTTSLLGD